MITIGIDPGLTGAIAFVGPNLCVIEDLPTMALPGSGLVRNKIDGRALAKLVLMNVPPGEKALVFCEQVSTMGGKNNAVQTQGSLMRTLGAIEAVFECLRMAPSMVHPQKWKRWYGLLDSKQTDSERKKASLLKAHALYPDTTDTSLRLAKHHNRAEALLIAHWALRTNE